MLSDWGLLPVLWLKELILGHILRVLALWAGFGIEMNCQGAPWDADCMICFDKVASVLTAAC